MPQTLTTSSKISAGQESSRWWTWFKASVIALLVAACSCTSAFDAETFNSYLESEPRSLDPAFAVDVASGRLCSLVFDTLVRSGPDGEPAPCLAKQWEVTADGRLYTFHLKEAYFSDGTRVSAGDVKYSLERLLRPDVGSPRSWVLAPVLGAKQYSSGAAPGLSGLRIPDDSTVVLELDEPFPAFLSLLGMPAASVVSRAWMSSADPVDWRKPVCSGPWAVEQWREGQEIVFKANGHHDPGPRLRRLSFRVLPERMTQVAEFEVGNLDHLRVPRAELSRWAEDPKWGGLIERQVELAVTYVGLNNRKTPFDDVRVRRALNYAVDLDAIVSGLMKGAAHKAVGAVPPGLRGHDSTREGYRYDPGLATALLREAGYANGLTMEIWYRDGGGGEQVLEAIQAYLKRVGIRVVLRAREWGTLKEAINRGVPDAYFLDWYADYPDAENFLFPLFHSSNWGGGGNRARYSNALVDSLLAVARTEPDPETRYSIYSRIDELVYNDAPWIYLWHPVRTELRQPWVRGLLLHPLFYGQRFVTVAKAAGGGGSGT